MKVQTVLAAFLFSGVLVLSACSDSNSGSGNENMAGAGLIGQPRPIGSEETVDTPAEQPIPTSIDPGNGGPIDVFYLEITADGDFNSYDFRGDAVNQGENCHTLESGTIVNLGGTRFLATLAPEIFQFNAEVTQAGLLLITSEDGGNVTLPPLRGLSALDFNLC